MRSDVRSATERRVGAGARAITWALAAATALIATGWVMTWLDPRWLDSLNRKKRDAIVYFRHLGFIRMHEGNLTAAAAAYERAVQLGPDNADALIDLGGVNVRLGKSDRAVELFERALALDPGEPALAYRNLAIVHARRWERPRAVELYRKAVETASNPTEALLAVGTLEFDRGNRAEAIRVLRRGLELHLDPKAQYRAALLRFKAANRDDPERLARVEARLAEPITDEDLRFYDLEALKQARLRLALTVRLHYSLGLALVEEGQPEEGLSHLREAAAILPKASFVRETLERAEARVREAKQEAAPPQETGEPAEGTR